MNQALVEWTARLVTTYEERIREEIYVINLIESAAMHSWTNGKDTTPELLERAKQAVIVYCEGIEIMLEAKSELARSD